MSHHCIREVTIDSDFSWWKDDYMEFYIDLNKRGMTEEGMRTEGKPSPMTAVSPYLFWLISQRAKEQDIID